MGPDSLEARVLGTTLQVDAAGGRTGVGVAVFSGAVRVTVKGRSVLLKDGEETLTTKEGIDKQPIKDSGAVLAWLEKLRSFHFRKVGFVTLMRRLGDWYHFTVLNPGDFPDAPLSFDFQKELPADSAISTIRLMEKGFADVKKINDTTYLITASQSSQ
jgi:hypothetical protein